MAVGLKWAADKGRTRGRFQCSAEVRGRFGPTHAGADEMTILLQAETSRFHERSAEPQIPWLRSPGFPVELGGVDGYHAPFLKRKAHTRSFPVLRGRKSGSG
jgi:hypothetical protein